jgi:hypothetical protein
MFTFRIPIESDGMAQMAHLVDINGTLPKVSGQSTIANSAQWMMWHRCQAGLNGIRLCAAGFRARARITDPR